MDESRAPINQKNLLKENSYKERCGAYWYCWDWLEVQGVMKGELRGYMGVDVHVREES